MQTLPIAQVLSPRALIRYIAHARSHHGFVVQRRYRGVGEPRYSLDRETGERLWKDYDHFEPQLVPFLNPGAVQAAGLSAKAIMRWSAAHPGQIFTHPTYAALCLSWGENEYGYRVEELRKANLHADEVPFTPRTCWQTGTTYYEFALSSNEDALFNQLRNQGVLRYHARELGLEGNWQGWYATDQSALEQALTRLERRLVLAQTQVRYGVWLEMGPPERQRLLAQYTTVEEARAYFDGLPEQSVSSPDSFTAGFGCMVQLVGQPEDCWTFDEKHIAAYHVSLLLEETGSLVTRWVLPQDLTKDLADEERPLVVEVPTLKTLLIATGFPRQYLPQMLGWSSATLQERERDPSQLTMAEIEQIAVLISKPVTRLVTELREEVRAKQAVGLLKNGLSVAKAEAD